MNKRLVIFDLDGTLAESKSGLDDAMAVLLARLLAVVKVAVISGGDWPQFERQLLSRLPDVALGDLSLLPTCGTKFYRHDGNWRCLYSEDFTGDEKKRILAAFETVIDRLHLRAPRIWGDVVEDRGSQITFSALGQLAPADAKASWDPDFAKRTRMKTLLDELVPDVSIRLGGMTSVDVTRRGIDKAYGIAKLERLLEISIPEMLFIGDALFPGGNDQPVADAGVASIRVEGPSETRTVITTLLACLPPALAPNLLSRS